MKQVIIARIDLKMSPGKLAAQVAHASISAYRDARADAIHEWVCTGMTKIVLQVSDEQSLLNLQKAAIKAKLPNGLVCDEGRTELKPNTYTCLGIGPANEKDIDKLTGSLKLY